MFKYEYIATQPVFFLFIAFSFLLTFGYFWGKRQNKLISIAAFNDIMKVVRPDDHTFTNIGGAIGYHANMTVSKKGAFLSHVDATITLLPRHSWLYLPVSKLMRKYDRLFITLHLKKKPSEEAHLIEKNYQRFRTSRITNEAVLESEKVKWGKLDFTLYYASQRMRDSLLKFIEKNPGPGTLRHIAIVPEQKKSFIFMVPKKENVATYLAPVYQWIPSLLKE